jgi:hypothetical protein
MGSHRHGGSVPVYPELQDFYASSAASSFAPSAFALSALASFRLQVRVRLPHMCKILLMPSEPGR